MGLTPLSFTGVSTYSQDFVTILQRAEQVASLPLRALQNQKSDLLQRKTLTTSLQGMLASFQSALSNAADVGDRRGMTAQSSQPAKVTISGVSANEPAVYNITEITSVARAASETSLTGYATSNATTVSASGTVRLTLGGTTRDITLDPSQNNLAGLRDAINNLGLGVRASIFTTGTGPAPNFLSLSATETGATTLRLTEDPAGTPVELLTSANQGANAEFKLNGVTVSRARNLVNDVVTGVSFTIAGTTTGSESVTLTLASDRGQLASTLRNVTSALNDLRDFLDSQIGESAGLLTGSTVISQTSDLLRRFTASGGFGEVRGLASLGMVADNRGRFSFDESALSSLNPAALADAFQTVSRQGFGSFAARFAELSDPGVGVVRAEQQQFDRTEARLNAQIAELTDRIQLQQAQLRLRLQAADALLAGLESQQRTISASIDSLNVTLFGRRDS